jgi:hypothetical protein
MGRYMQACALPGGDRCITIEQSTSRIQEEKVNLPAANLMMATGPCFDVDIALRKQNFGKS